MPGIHSAASKSGRCRGTFAVLNVGENGEARKVNLKDDSKPVYIRLADGTVQRLRSVNQIREAEKAGLGPVTCAQLQKGSRRGQPSFHPGNLIHEVVEGTAAHRAGLLAGDEIEAVIMIDPDTGKPQLDAEGKPIRIASGDMRSMRAALDDNPNGVFDIVARRDGKVLTLRMEGGIGPSAADQAEETAAAGHDSWRAAHLSKAGEDPVYVDTPEGPVNVNVPFAELPEAYAKHLVEAGRVAAEAAAEHHRTQLGQAGAGGHYRFSELAYFGMAERVYNAHVAGTPQEKTPFSEADPELQERYRALTTRALSDMSAWGTLHGINAPFGPALSEGERGYVRIGAGVRAVAEGSSAAGSGLEAGDRIVGVAGRPGMSLNEIEEMLVQLAEDGVDRTSIVVNRHDRYGQPVPVLVEIPTGSLSSLGVTLGMPAPAGVTADHSTMIPIPPEFRVFTEDDARAALEDISRGGDGYHSTSSYSLSKIGDGPLRILESHKDAYGKGAEKVSALAAAPLPHVLKQQAYKLYGGKEEALPLEKFAPEGKSPIEAALSWTGAPCRIETPHGNVEARVAAAIMTLAELGISVADNPEMRARAEYVSKIARLDWPGMVAAGVAGTGSVYEGLIRTTGLGDTNNIADTARWIASGQSEFIVEKTLETQRTAEEILGRPDRWNIERSDRGTVLISRVEGSGGGKVSFAAEQVGHAYGPAVVFQTEPGLAPVVSVAESLGDGGLERLADELNEAERQARRQKRLKAAMSQAEHAAKLKAEAEQVASASRREEMLDTARRAQQLAEEKAAAIDDTSGDPDQTWYPRDWGYSIGSIVSPLGGSSLLDPEQVAAMVDTHLRGEYDLPPMDSTAALGVSDLENDPEAARSVSSAVADTISMERGWNQVMAATPGYAGLVGAHPDVVHRAGLHLRPKADTAESARVGTVLLTNDPHDRLLRSPRSRSSERLVVAITEDSDPNGRRIVTARGEEIGDTKISNLAAPSREEIMAARRDRKGSRGFRVQRIPQAAGAR